MSREYDLLIVGSSPVCIAEAIYQASIGHSVCLVEKGDFGGSWKCRDLFGLKNVELGPHVFNGYKRDIKALRLFGVKPEPVDIGYFDTTEEKLYKNNLDAGRYQAKIKFWIKRIHEKPINFLKLLYNLCQLVYVKFFNKIPRGYYLKGGTYELLSRLTSNKNWSKVKQVKARVTKIDVFGGSNCIVLLDNGDAVQVNQVILPLCSDLNLRELCPANSSEFKIEQNDFSSTQVVLKIKNNKIKNFFSSFLYGRGSYIGNKNFLAKKSLKYISDITGCVSYNNNIDLEFMGISIITVAVDTDVYIHDNSLDSDKLISDLICYDFISKESELIDYYFETVFGKITDSSIVKEFNLRFNGKIQLLKSESLLDSFSENYRRWKSSKRIKK